jgi:hypothetical protein
MQLCVSQAASPFEFLSSALQGACIESHFRLHPQNEPFFDIPFSMQVFPSEAPHIGRTGRLQARASVLLNHPLSAFGQMHPLRV